GLVLRGRRDHVDRRGEEALVRDERVPLPGLIRGDRGGRVDPKRAASPAGAGGRVRDLRGGRARAPALPDPALEGTTPRPPADGDRRAHPGAARDDALEPGRRLLEDRE